MLYLKSIELTGFKSFGKKTELVFDSPIAAIVGPNGSGKSNVAEGFRFVLGEQSMKSMRSKRGEDLIWGGSPALPRANRAGVKVVFNNSKRLLDIDFSEVVIERVVYRDGQNEYLLNGTQVRLKDIIRLLAGANIGGSGYQIISQGEADRILNASPRERREMVEDALGLKLYQHKKAESERKLAEAAVNIDKTRSLRRELAPHLTFLRSQVEKIEKAREMKDELSAKLADYLARENAYLTQETARVKDEEHARARELRDAEERIAAARDELERHASAGDRGEHAEKLAALEAARVAARREREQLVREMGRAEAALEFAERGGASPEEGVVPASAARTHAQRLSMMLAEAEAKESVEDMRVALRAAREEITRFIGTLGEAPAPAGEAREAHAQVEELARKLAEATETEERAERALAEFRRSGEEGREARHEAERNMLTHEAAKRELTGKLSAARQKLEELAMLSRRFEEEVREGVALVGAAVRGWENAAIPEGALSEERSEQEKRRRAIERLKIKIEEAGTGEGEQILREFTQTKERDEFLARELADLERSAQSLKTIIAELEKTIDERFTEGLKHINEALAVFFAKLFGGGEAKLEVEAPRVRRGAARENLEDEDDALYEEEEELYAGLSISVSLPRKKVRGLEVLSGGERALTSIALIFSMSQVNPPPFLILDETDAALDEANSRRYADMIKELSRKSQLIVITHNRATMAAAGELYGVTMDSSGVSKVLSVKLEEAERVAK
ncbi:hypothetical protein COU20_04110 [Candidatus Kaiserbacteria bacterium CG10_big_fil_rev_8_21_14_0_10_59_10]|uniref:RecF/RecN/SMC N-terminal domain-containing protein n=1 Tax=Candidatus Kaiserbacteria bacterium CG10_big_fil_rev_8_21_14_0_10_59_10 TaxID=1974612 RepID=A0A2H0U6T7_9BACT|nr:MAG: hypothetical protein COU20_04110 [Candidatus Kaiserbacteria bacterium CG10_big_fil_rev_8_21_14_0_10_59_10]